MGIITPFAHQGIKGGCVFNAVLGGKAKSALAFAFSFLTIKWYALMGCACKGKYTGNWKDEISLFTHGNRGTWSWTQQIASTVIKNLHQNTVSSWMLHCFLYNSTHVGLHRCGVCTWQCLYLDEKWQNRYNWCGLKNKHLGL